MSNASSAPHHATETGRAQQGNCTVKILGLEIPLPAWAITPMAVMAVIAVPIFLFLTLYHMQGDANATEALRHTKENLQQAQSDLKSVQDNLRNTRDDYEEYVRHTSEPGSEFHRETKLTVKYYESDGCIYVLRSAGGAWLRDPARRTPASPSPDEIRGGQRSEVRLPALGSPIQLAVDHEPSLVALVKPAVMLSGVDETPTDVEQSAPATGGACLNPHPGSYQSSDGQKKGCWQQIWRRWPDGCVHYQWFNTCSSYWETDAKGRPAVHWTSCRH